MLGLNHEILTLEWDMFSRVSNAGGKAPCQSDPATFSVMRGSQIAVWPEALRQSYLEDLKCARREGRNLMSEKYAWMMESGFPDEFKRLRPLLPEIGKESLDRIEAVVAVHLRWKEETARRLPRLSGRGRPVYTKDDTTWETSFETYLRGELKTYSARTLALYHEYTETRKAEGANCVALTLLEQVKRYGYASLKEAEKMAGT